MPEGGVVPIKSPLEGGVSQASVGLHMVVVLSGHLAGVDDVLLNVTSPSKWTCLIFGTGAGFLNWLCLLWL